MLLSFDVVMPLKIALTPFFLRACKVSGNFTVRSESKGKAVGGF